MKVTCLAASFLMASTSLAFADTAAYSLKQTGASFIEAPPSRDSNLAPMGLSGSEKVETHAVISFSNRLITDIPTFGKDARVTATAIFGNKSRVTLGTAEYSAFRKTSDDKKKSLFTISVSRLPDKPIVGVDFSGTIQFSVAKSLKKLVSSFQPKSGTKISGVLGNITISKIEGTSLALTGDSRLSGVASVKVIKSDGTVMAGEKVSYSLQGLEGNSTVISQWQFNQPIPSGKIELSYYDGLETIEVPVSFLVMKPY